MAQRKILLIEDDHSLKSGIEAFLQKLGFQVTSCNDAESALKIINEEFDLILSDVQMKTLTGYDLLKFVRKRYPNLPLILMTAYGTIEKAVVAMKNGAYDFLVKPFSLSVLETALNAAILDRQAILSLKDASVEIDSQSFLSPHILPQKVSERFLTASPKIIDIIENLKRIAPSKATVLIQGESGTGKELIAHMIHEFSPRSQRIFVAINCAAMPDTLLESELFGHEKGAFTGAVARQIGKFELSNNGTILLDEISEMSINMQTKLLRVLQECEIYRVGGIRPIPLNIRVIATTNRDLFQYMKQGHFREDLYYRINVIPVMVPPLRERGNDLLLLAQEFLNEFAILHGKKAISLDEKAKRKILHHLWHGNVRELRNAMERVVLVDDFDVIEESGLTTGPKEKAVTSSFIDSAMSLADLERRVIVETLDKFEGNKTKTANQLKISLRTLRNKLKSFEVNRRPSPKEKGESRTHLRRRHA